MQMKNLLRDRVLVGVVSGIAGSLAKMAVDEVSLRMKISERSFRSTAAGVWVRDKRDAESPQGQVLGGILDFLVGALGGVGMVEVLSRTGRDYMVTKGLLGGIGLGSTITALLSMFPTNKVQPKSASSNLSYLAAHAVYGLVTISAASFLGHPSIFDAEPRNDHLVPTELTTEQKSVGNAADGLPAFPQQPRSLR